MDLISVIVPIYNQEKFLEKCLDSICSQTYTNLEIILVNDGSKDSSLSICQQWAQKDSRIKIIDQKNGGLSNARNSGFKLSTGKYISFIDSDDYIDKDFYKYLIEKKKDRVIATCKVVGVVDGEFVKDESKKDLFISKKDYLADVLMHLGDISAWSKLFDRKMIEGIEFKEGIYNEDLLFMFDLLDRFDSIEFSEKSIYYHVLNRNSVSRVFGKTIHDAINNAKIVRKIINEKYPDLSDRAERFEIYQNLLFLLSIPKKYKRKNDPMCKSCYKFIRKNFFKGLKNKYLARNDKMKLIITLLMPHIVPYLAKNK